MHGWEPRWSRGRRARAVPPGSIAGWGQERRWEPLQKGALKTRGLSESGAGERQMMSKARKAELPAGQHPQVGLAQHTAVVEGRGVPTRWRRRASRS